MPLLLAIRAMLRPGSQATNQVKAVVLIPARLPGQCLGAEHGNVLSKEEGDEYYRRPALNLSLTPLANCCFNSVTSKDTPVLPNAPTAGAGDTRCALGAACWVSGSDYQRLQSLCNPPACRDCRTREGNTLHLKAGGFPAVPLPAFKAAPTFQ